MGPLTIAFWYEALASEFGVVVLISGDVELAKQKLYRLRTLSADRDLDQISICTSTTAQNEIWLVKKGNTDAP